ncbi:hypothetical protein G9A89_011897 [Geosiphon pyriformis]|nr:hypothetical protein G9A89_011897 [Geosiphon pyriformis]
MHLIVIEDFLGVVSDLSDNKAAGLSEAWVSIIPKPYNWKGVLTNTQLIALIETACKILSKILSDRISMACSKYDILHGNNFSVFKGTTMQSLIFVIGLVVEDVLEKNCELWLVLQDMKKAYNSIGWEHLRRSLVKIKMCNRFIRFFGSIHDGCMNRMMTDFGLTDEYSVHNGLDQGEVFSSLLWCIFYDTLLCKVKRQETVYGYRLNLYYVVKSGRIDSQDSLTSFLAVGAFAATQYILNVASEFFRMNDISINNNKTVVIPINCRVMAPFLSFFANFVLRKAISNKQFSYLVLAWNVLIRKGLKLKLGLPLDFPNNVLHYSLFYSLKTFEQIQAKDKIAAVVCFTNSVGLVFSVFLVLPCLH